MSLFQQATGLLTGMLSDGFHYNRDNYLYDRKQRQVMEYQLAEMRIKQVSLWRQDIRDSINLAPRKMQVYLTVIALELNATAIAMCKARVPPGVPAWLAACHTLAVGSCLIYLLMGLWFGLQAFVSAQAYKVRILTQLVRLPVPSWQALEASRTYASSFESIDKKQMLRVPFVLGPQESRLRLEPIEEQPAVAEVPGEVAPNRNVGDPWGLERPGDHLPELQPEVNVQVEKQRHVWLIREAARYYQTYDAFCRISLSAGTNSLAQFFAFFCLTYVLTENAAPVAAWAAMAVFNGISIMFLRIDLLLRGRQYFTAIVLLLLSPILCSAVSFVSSRNRGDPKMWEILMPVALFSRGVWHVYYLVLFRVEELQNSALLPMAYKAVLFIDPFAWARHSGAWLRHLRGSFESRGVRAGTPTETMLPSQQCMGPDARRPEDSSSSEGSPYGGFTAGVSFRPRTFATFEGEPNDAGAEDGADIHGDRPGLVPWRYFFINTIVIVCMWWVASLVSVVHFVQGRDIYVKGVYGLKPGVVAPLHMLHGVRVETTWDAPLVQARGLACDPHGFVLATTGRAVDGRKTILRGHVGQNSTGTSSVHFTATQPCESISSELQDFTLHGCDSQHGCTALVLPKQGQQLVPCPLETSSPARVEGGKGLETKPLARGWLEDRGGSPLDGSAPHTGLLHPEEVASLLSVPCFGGAPDSHCAVVGTTARRVVQLAAGGQQERWIPKRLLKEDHGEVPWPGSFALLSKRYLAALQRETSVLRVSDLQGGQSMGSYTLHMPSSSTPRPWSSICAGGDSLYALEGHENPTLWRFAIPSQLTGMCFFNN